MKRKRLCLLIAMLCLLLGCTARSEVEMLAVSVGKGDAILLCAGDYRCLIDTGKSDAEEALRRALDAWQINELDAVFITHTDKDHTGGLKWLRKSDIEIHAIYASRYFPESSLKKHQAVKTADKLGLEVNWLGAGDVVPMGDSGAVLRVLAPEVEIPENEDDNSLVMLLDSPDGRILLAGDMEYAEEQVLLQSGADLKCDVLKVPNHGDDDACSATLVNACAPAIAVISTDSQEKAGTPSEPVLQALREAGCEIYVTQDCSLGVRITLNQGNLRAEALNW